MSGEIETDADLVAELFEETSSFENIPATRKKLIREKSLVDSQLQTGIQSQMQKLAEGTRSLQLVRERVGQTEFTLRSMSEVYDESVQHVPGFEDILSIAMILNNFDLTKKFGVHLESFTQQLALAQSLMQEDGEFDIDSPMPNLIPTHYILSQLRQVRDEAYMYLKAKDATSDTRLTVRKLYEPLNMVTQMFDETLMAIAEALLEVLRVGNRSLVVRVAKIIEAEERQDVVAKLSQKDPSNGRGASDPNVREARQYLERFFKTIESSIKAQFDNCMSTFPPDTQPNLLLENLSFVNSELIGAKEDLEPCCPARWKIFNRFVLWYHQGVHRTLETILRFEPPAETLLDLLRYVKDYYSTMSKAFNISKKSSPELLDPPLLDGRERDLYDDYLNLLVSKLKQWYAAIWAGEKQDFLNNQCAYTTTPDGYVGLDTHTTVTKLIAQQLETAANSGQARVIAGCVDACCEVITTRQQNWVELMQEATKKHTRDSQVGPYEYILVIANDQDRSYSFLEQLSAKWSEPMPPRYQGRVIEKFGEAQEGFQEVTKKCFLMSLEIIYKTIEPAFPEIFQSRNWYAGATIKAVVDTLESFVDDAKVFLISDLFDIFLGKLCTESVLWYLRAMIPQPGHGVKKLNLPQAKERILEDAQMLYQFFTREQYGLDADQIRDVFFIFDLFCDVLTSPFDEITALFRELRAKERDAPIDIFECMLNLRKDVDPKALKDIMSEIRSVVIQSEPLALGTDAEDTTHSFLYEFNKD